MSLECKIYESELRAYKYGRPLYQPNPNKYDIVRVGDVGVIDNDGHFLRIFNCLAGADHPINQEKDAGGDSDYGVPPDFEPLDPINQLTKHKGDIKSGTPLGSSHITEVEAGGNAAGNTSAGVSVGAGFTVSMTRFNAAALRIGTLSASRTEAVRKANFKAYFKKNYQSWADFICSHGISSDIRDMIFVTGHTLTSDWETAVHVGEQSSWSFSALMNSLPALFSGSLLRRSQYTIAIPGRTGPDEHGRYTGPRHKLLGEDPTPDESGPIRDQCIFVDGLYVADRKLVKVIKAMAEPENPDTFRDSTPSIGLLSDDCISDNNENKQDISDHKTVLDYILYYTDTEIAIVLESVVCIFVKENGNTKSPDELRSVGLEVKAELNSETNKKVGTMEVLPSVPNVSRSPSMIAVPSTTDQADNDGYLLDVLFLLDATASMDPYIKSVRERIIEICTILNASGRLKQRDGLQMGLLAYRDYPEEETEFVVKPHPFTFDVRDIKEQLHNLVTKRNRDIAKAFRTALDYALTKMKGWRKKAMKVVIVVTDAAPHGIKEDTKKDRYPDTGPEDELSDPLKLAISKADENYSIVILACEPTLSHQSEYAIDFYKALAHLSHGVYLPLTDHRALSTLILGSLLEKMDLKSLSDKYREYILERVLKEGAPVETVIDEMHERLQNEGEQVMSVKASNPYNDSVEAIHNYYTFLSKETLEEARPSLQPLSTRRINGRAEQEIRAKQNEIHIRQEIEEGQNKGDSSTTVEVRFVNRGESTIIMKHYNNQIEALNTVTIPGGFIHSAQFKVNVANNFMFASGTITKMISRTFDRHAEIEVHQLFA